jgi:hypothetical protein
MAQFKAAYFERESMRGQPANAFRFVRPDWRRFVKPGSDAWVLYELYERKFNPEQPRVAAGNSEGGQWVGDGGDGSSDGNSPRNTDSRPTAEGNTKIAARISQARAEECEIQKRKDDFICKAFKSEPCYGQAMLRYANCLQGLPIPPLNF